MKDLMKKIIGKKRFIKHSAYYYGMGLPFPSGESHFLDLKCDSYTGTSSSLHEYIGFLQPLTVELYLIDETEFWCKFHDRLSEENCVQMVKSVLVPDEFDFKETGYYRLWWDEYDVMEGEELIEKINNDNSFYTGAINMMKYWLSNNWKKIDWSGLHMVVRNGNTKNNSNKLKEKLFGNVTEELGKTFKIKADPVKNFSLILDQSDYDLSVTINGMEFWWVPDHTVIGLYKYAYAQIKSRE